MTTHPAVGTDMSLDQIKDTINGLVQQGNTGAHQIGVLYNYVVDNRLAINAGYKDARTYFNQNIKAISQATLSLYGRVAKAFPEATCTQYGPHKLRALLVYAQETDLVLVAGEDPGPVVIDVPQDDETVAKQPFAECSVDDVERATRSKKAPPKVQVPVTDQARLLFITHSLTRAFSGIAPVRLTSRNSEGQTLISVQDVPMGKLKLFMQAMQEGLEAEPATGASAKHAAA